MFSSPLEAAVALARRGFYLFPLGADSKLPAVKHWKEWATNDPKKILDSEHTGNWAIVPGMSSHMVVDVDVKDKGEQSLTALCAIHDDLPATFAVATPSGGQHIYLAGTSRPSIGKVAKGIDIRSLDSYVVAPGSLIKGVAYEIETDAPIALCPDWLIKKAQAVAETKKIDRPAATKLDVKENIEAAVDYLTTTDPCVRGSEKGSEHLYVVAAQVRDRGISEEKARELLELHFLPRCDPPWDLMDPERQERFDKLVGNAYAYAQNPIGAKSEESIKAALQEEFKDIIELPEEAAAPAPPIPLRQASLIVGEEIKKRDWIIAGMTLTGFASVTAAPGGSGKSNLEALKAICIVTGRSLLGERYVVKKKGPVILFNGEDPLEEMERRIEAFRIHLDLQPEDLKDLYLVSGQDHQITVAKIGQDGVAVPNKPDIKRLIATAQAVGAIQVSLDPLISFHDVSEQANVDMKKVVEAFKAVAKRAQCAISLVHHTSKSALKDTSEASDNPIHIRGASATVDAVRVAHTVRTMTADEALKMAVPQHRRRWFFKLELAKANLSAPAEYADWFESKGVVIPNGEEVGVCSFVTLQKDKDERQRQEEVEHGEALLVLLGGLLKPGHETTVLNVHQAAAQIGMEWPDKNPGRFKNQITNLLFGVQEYTIFQTSGRGTWKVRREAQTAEQNLPGAK